jgi:hypothetical protein
MKLPKELSQEMPSTSIEINVIIEQNIKIIYYAILLFKCSVYDKFNEDYKFYFTIYFHKSIYKFTYQIY